MSKRSVNKIPPCSLCGIQIHCIVLYCTVLYFTVLYCTVLYCTVLYCTVLYCAVVYFSLCLQGICASSSNSYNLLTCRTTLVRTYTFIHTHVNPFAEEFFIFKFFSCFSSLTTKSIPLSALCLAGIGFERIGDELRAECQERTAAFLKKSWLKGYTSRPPSE